MSPADRAAVIVASVRWGTRETQLGHQIEAAITEAVEEERERCARMAEANIDADPETIPWLIRDDLERAVTERSKEHLRIAGRATERAKKDE